MPQHPSHTCRHLHRCKHRNHKAPTTTTPSDPPADPPVQPPTEPTGEAPAEPRVEEPVETPAEPPVQEPVETPAEPPVEEPVEPPVEAPPAEPGFADAPLPTAASLHLASRFTYGMTPALHAEMRATGSPEAWFEEQLDPAAIPDDRADGIQSWWSSIDLDAAAIWQRDQSEVEDGWRAMANYACWCLLRRIYSRRQVLEVMTEFWENHLHVPVHDDGVFTYRADYGKVDPLARAGTVRRDAGRRDHPPRDEHLPRQRRSRPRRHPTRTSAASCSSCTPSGAATTPRTT